MPAQPDELLNDCHFTLYFKQPHVMASYSNLLYLRFLPLGAFVYGPDISLVKNSEERFGLFSGSVQWLFNSEGEKSL